MSTGVDIIEPIADTRTARQVARDTRKHEAMARKRLTSRGDDRGADHRDLLDDPHVRPVRHVVPPRRGRAEHRLVDGVHRPVVHAENYEKALTSGGTALTLGQSFLNSLAITIPVVFFALAVASLLAYAFAWIDFKGRNLAFIAVFALQIVPLQMALVPLLSLFSRGLTIGDVTVFPALDLRDSSTASRRCGSRTRSSRCRWRCSCCTTSSRRSRARSSRRRGWTGQATGRSSSG
jgi:alpha-glucoside transport system permease protein